MKRSVLAVLAVLSVLGLASCNGTSTSDSVSSGSVSSVSASSSVASTVTGSIKAIGETSFDLKVGASQKVTYKVTGSNKEVTLTSSNITVVTVDEFDNVTAVGPGTATVTVAMKADASKKVVFTFNVSKSFWRQDKGYFGGTVNFDKEDEGIVTATDGQEQVLADINSTRWYFATTIKNVSNPSDVWGQWGVGSFLVDDQHAIGNNMFWYGLSEDGSEVNKKFSNFYGGWRWDVNDPNGGGQLNVIPGTTREQFSVSTSDEAKFVFIRDNVKNYVYFDAPGDQPDVKFEIDVPYFKDQATYPGVFGQNQNLEISNWEGSADDSVVDSKLKELFGTVESIEIDKSKTIFTSGETYQLKAKINPTYVYDQSVIWSLDGNAEGITLTEDGKLTIEKGKAVKFKVKATSKLDSTKSATAEFESSNTVEVTGAIDPNTVASSNPDDIEIAADQNSMVIKGGAPKVAFNAKGTEWNVEFKATGLTDSSIIGIGSASDSSFANGMELKLNGASRTFTYTGHSDEKTMWFTPSDSMPSEMTIGLARKGNNYYLSLDGRLIDRFTSKLVEGESLPYFISSGNTNLKIDNVKVEKSVSTLLENNDYQIGGTLTENDDGSYTTPAYPAHWGPDYDFEAGIRNLDYVQGAFEMKATISGIKLAGDNLDAKVLMYLNGDNLEYTGKKTASVQLIIKGTLAKPEYKLCANLDDGHWDEVEGVFGNIDFTKAFTITVTKATDSKVTVKLEQDGVEAVTITSAEAPYLDGSYANWKEDFNFLPGITPFNCGMTIKDFTVTSLSK